MQDNKVVRDMLKFLNEEELKPQLITASLYLAAYWDGPIYPDSQVSKF